MEPRFRTLENTESRPRDMMRTRRHPFLASHNAWTWRFLPGIVVGFLAHLWFSHNRESKVNALLQAPPPPQSGSLPADPDGCHYFRAAVQTLRAKTMRDSGRGTWRFQRRS